MKATFSEDFFKSLEKLGMTDEEKQVFIQEIHDKFSNMTAEELQEQGNSLTEEEIEELGLKDFDLTTYEAPVLN